MNDVNQGGVRNLLRTAKLQFGVAVAFAALRKEDGSFAIATFPALGPETQWTPEAVDELVHQTWGDPLLSGGKVLVRSGHVLRGMWPGQSHPTKLAAAALSDLDAPHHPWGLLCVAEPEAGHFEQSQLDLLGSLATRLTAYLRARQQVVVEPAAAEPSGAAAKPAPEPVTEPEPAPLTEPEPLTEPAPLTEPEPAPLTEPAPTDRAQSVPERLTEPGRPAGIGGDEGLDDAAREPRPGLTGDSARVSESPAGTDPGAEGRYFQEEPFGYVAEDEELIRFLRERVAMSDAAEAAAEAAAQAVEAAAEELLTPEPRPVLGGEAGPDIESGAEAVPDAEPVLGVTTEPLVAASTEASGAEASSEASEAVTPGAPLIRLGVPATRWSFGDDPAAQLFRPEPLTGLVGLPSLMGGLGQALGYLRTADPSAPRRIVALSVADVAPSVGEPPLPDVAYMIIAARMRALSSPGDLVARIGENTFSVLLTPVAGSRDPELTRRRMVDAVLAPMEPSFGVLLCRAALEIATIDAPVPGPEDMFRRVLSQLGAM